MFNDFLKVLANVLHFTSLEADQNGACLIVMKESGIPLLFEYDDELVPNHILISTHVVDFPMERRVEIYEMILKANHIMEATLSVKPGEDQIYLHQRISPEIPDLELNIVIQTFLEHVHMIKKAVEESLHNPPSWPTIPSSTYRAG